MSDLEMNRAGPDERKSEATPPTPGSGAEKLLFLFVLQHEIGHLEF